MPGGIQNVPEVKRGFKACKLLGLVLKWAISLSRTKLLIMMETEDEMFCFHALFNLIHLIIHVFNVIKKKYQAFQQKIIPVSVFVRHNVTRKLFMFEQSNFHKKSLMFELAP